MGRRSRHSAKTGDTALYRSRSSADDGDGGNSGGRRGGKGRSDDNSDDDAMYDEVDRYHNRKEAEREEFLRLDGGAEEDDSEEEADDGITHGREGVFDLGVGGSDDDDEDKESSSSSEDNDDDDDDDDDEASAASSSSSSSAPDESDLRGLRPSEDVLDWGTSKSSYYHGDTADIEIGQDEEDAELEEEAGREVLRKRYEGVDEDDFMMDEAEEEEEEEVEEKAEKKGGKSDRRKKEKEATKEPAVTQLRSSSSSKKLAELSKSDRRRLLGAAHPEFLPLVEHFRDGPVRELRDVTRVLCRALLGDSVSGVGAAGGFRTDDAEAVGATPAGLRYLLTKALLQTSAALNVCQYLLLKSECSKGRRRGGDGDGEADSLGDNDDEEEEEEEEEDPVRSHPVISRLRELNDLSDALSADVESKVPDLREQVEGLVKAAKLMEAEKMDKKKKKAGDEDESDSDSDSDGDGDGEDAYSSDEDAEAEAEAAPALLNKRKAGALRADDSDSSSDDEEEESEEDEAVARRRLAAEARFGLRGRGAVEDAAGSSRRRCRAPLAGDYGDEDEEDDHNADKGRRLAGTINAISQRRDVRRGKKGGKDAAGSAPETVDDEDEERVRRGLEMMEADIGADSDEDDGGGDSDDAVDDELDDDLDDGGFYARVQSKAASKKSAKRARYAVAPKYPSLDVEVEGERGLSRTILKNRGLVAHKSKLNRNPRVKKREQYRKALIRRKGAVRDVRTDEGHKYGGETTGIKAGISRSRKLGVRR